MSDPATTALAVQMEYGDDELKKDVDERIRVVVREELVKLFNDPSIGERFIINNAYILDKQMKRAVKSMFENLQVY
jgi:hypothetical protein